MNKAQWFETLWGDYTEIAPKVSHIKSLLEAKGEQVENDHIAFRTYDISPIDVESLGAIVETLGYSALDTYDFPTKKVSATSYVHPEGGPRIFLSELRVDELSDSASNVIRKLAGQVDPAQVKDLTTFVSGRLWDPLTHQEYLTLREESEYGSWVAAHGLRPNHFTVSVNALNQFETLEDLVGFVAEQGYALNESGGIIKGSPGDFLEQASTLADTQKVEFADGPFEIPTCYYEFAFRHPTSDGTLFNGFVTKSADKIFESTDAR